MHDRVQEAFYLMMDVHNREVVHLKIAQLLQDQAGTENMSQEILFTIAHNYSILVTIIKST